MFYSYHFQALKPISNRALLAGFLMIWLKKCVVPTHPHEVLLPTVAMLAERLVTWYSVALLSAMMLNLQYSLHQLIAEFLRGTANP